MDRISTKSQRHVILRNSGMPTRALTLCFAGKEDVLHILRTWPRKLKRDNTNVQKVCSTQPPSSFESVVVMAFKDLLLLQPFNCVLSLSVQSFTQVINEDVKEIVWMKCQTALKVLLKRHDQKCTHVYPKWARFHVSLFSQK